MTEFVSRRPSHTRMPSALPTLCVTFLAIALFVATGSSLLSTIVKHWRGLGPPAEQPLVVAFLLTIALLLLGWRRSVELKRHLAARLEAERAAKELAHRDLLTGLANRASLAQFAAEQPGWGRGLAAMLVVDLDHFKKVNDLHGHAAGDTLLRWFGHLLQDLAPPDACCARLSGDEFAVFIGGEGACEQALEDIANRITKRLSDPVDVEGRQVHIGASIGIASAVAGEVKFEELLRRGDIAMYEAKGRGKNCFAWFTEKMGQDLKRRNELEAEMREGVGRGEFVPYFQPQVQLASGELHGFEVLARWQHPTRGLMEPAEFIAIAEASGLIANLSLSVMKQALTLARNWHAPLTIAINISPVQLKDPLLGAKIAKILIETGFPAQRLELEITESSFFEDMDLAIGTIESLKNLGVKMSLDDFGTGYSSLTQLQALPFDRIKIDRSFVMTMGNNEESAAIVNAILHLAKSLKLPVTAEGIETSDIGNILAELGCADGQGWLYGKPLPSTSIETNLDVCAEERPQLTLAGTPGAKVSAARQLHERRDLLRRGTKRRASS